MRSSFFIAANDLRLFFRERGNLVGLLVVPVILTIILGIFFPGGDETQAAAVIDVVDEDHSQASAAFLESIRRANDSLRLCPMDNDSEDPCALGGQEVLDIPLSQERIRNSDTLGAVIIPQGYEDAVSRREAFQIRYLADPGYTSSLFVQQALQAALQEVNGAVQAVEFGDLLLDRLAINPGTEPVRKQLREEILARAAALWAENPVRVDYQSSDSQEVQSGTAPPGFTQSVPGMATMYVMGTVFGGMVALIGERKRWTLQRLVMMPIPGAAILRGKLSGRFTLGMAQFLVVFAVGAIVGMNFGDSPLGLLMVMVAYTLAVTSISYALGTYLENEAQAGALSQLLVLTLAPLGGAWWPLEITPRFLQIIGHLSPVAWAMDGFYDLFLRGGDAASVLPETFVLLGFALAFSILGSRRFRYA